MILLNVVSLTGTVHWQLYLCSARNAEANQKYQNSGKNMVLPGVEFAQSQPDIGEYSQQLILS